ncbi:hypothetical protein Clacol_008373 [Clathrus columnatus]|uniref:FAD-binding domain-containing protein n=1 Tax=Clathrus columnatus TaxID=1419009 RepID=A0AAV5AHJ0_9AGAM|nr:hypothetical protein Clacol_008373 [Clathrus columnatus]
MSLPTGASARGIAQTIQLYPTAPLKLSVIVVGCGMGGLAAAFALAKAGHDVTLLESANEIGEVGAGIQVTPNLSRLLIKWGLGGVLERMGVRPQSIVFRRYCTGEMVGKTDWRDMEETYGAPYYHVHRADLHRILYDLVLDTSNVKVRLAATVIDVGVDADDMAWVKLQNGEIVRSHLVIAADGVKSLIREHITPHTKATPTGDAAYRAIVPCSQLLSDPELCQFVENPEMTAWMAPGRHLMAYCIRAKQEYNLVLIHPDDGSVESWTAQGSADKMRKDFEDFEPRVQKLLSFVPSTLKWKLMDRDPLKTWIHPKGHIILLGDACHPMLPYRAQGAAMAIEDAAVLGTLLSHISHFDQLPIFLKAYQDLRLDRTAETQLSSRLNQKIFHLPDGPEQRKRDADMTAAMNARGNDDNGAFEGNLNQWADKRKSQEQFGYDAYEAAKLWWSQIGQKEVKSLKAGEKSKL